MTAGLFTLTLMAMMLSAHPIAALVITALAAGGAAVHMADNRSRRREALAARADYEHRTLMRRHL